MDVFQVAEEEARLLYFGCEQLVGMASYYTPPKTVSQACMDNYNTYGQLLLGTAPRMLETWAEEGPFCLQRLVLGQGNVFNVPTNRPEPHFGIYLRKGRDAIVKHLQRDIPRPTRLAVMVLPKHEPGHTSSGLLGSGLCESVRTVVEGLVRGVEVGCVCFNVGVEEEMNLVRTATLIISEDGTVAYAGLFAHDGAVQIVLSAKEHVKESHTLPYASHVKVLFATLDDPDELLGTIRYGLHLAATNFDVRLEEHLLVPSHTDRTESGVSG